MTEPLPTSPVCRLALAWTVVLLLPTTSLAAHAAFTTTSELGSTAEAFLEQQVENYLDEAGFPARYQISISRLDPRLRLTRCDQPLQSSLENSSQPLGRVTLRVRCEGSSPWSVFVPAHVSIYRHIVVSARPLQRNSLLQAADLALAEHDISSLRQGYLLDPAEAIGAQTTRAFPAGQPVTPAQLKIPPAIRRGDKVVISARSAVVNVRMAGEALGDGNIGEQIRVRNTRSQRTVFARVVAPGQVEVDL